MKIFTFGKLGRTLLLAAAATVIGLLGCMMVTGDPDDTGKNNTGAVTHTHIWSNWAALTPATCDADGVETRICVLDDSHREVRTIPQLTGTKCNSTGGGDSTQTWGGWVVTTPATCDAPGLETRIDTKDANHKEIREIPRLTGAGCNTGGGGDHVHTWGDWVVTTQATCDAQGVETRTCTQDGSTETRAIAQLTGEACNTGGGGSGNNNCTSASTCKSKVMPDGKMWMTENLNIVTEESWCYGEGGQVYIGLDYSNSSGGPLYGPLTSSEIQANCNKYGRLYTLEAARTACPRGWHLPSSDEWDVLIKSAGGSSVAAKKLKSTSGWNEWTDAFSRNGTDDFGFSALPGGARSSVASLYSGVGEIGGWWSAPVLFPGDRRLTLIYRFTGDVAVGSDIDDGSVVVSVRCVAD
jgi:uncharacterized protein (TIGR02145 family)